MNPVAMPIRTRFEVAMWDADECCITVDGSFYRARLPSGITAALAIVNKHEYAMTERSVLEKMSSRRMSGYCIDLDLHRDATPYSSQSASPHGAA